MRKILIPHTWYLNFLNPDGKLPFQAVRAEIVRRAQMYEDLILYRTSVFDPKVQVPVNLVAETPALLKKCSKVRGTAGQRKAQLLKQIAIASPFYPPMALNQLLCPASKQDQPARPGHYLLPSVQHGPIGPGTWSRPWPSLARHPTQPNTWLPTTPSQDKSRLPTAPGHGPTLTVLDPDEPGLPSAPGPISKG